jgi:uncharacterized protein YfiM (DUF2279 family)
VLLFISLSVFLLYIPIDTRSQPSFFSYSDKYNQQRVNVIIVSETVVATAVTIGLNYLWYKKFPRSRFHFFNDNNEWLNMDKVGHACTTYNVSAIQTDMLRWAGVKPGQAAFIGTLTALGFMTLVEIMDGHSAKWGFSKGDMLANLAGCLLFETQQLAWNQQKISLKYSYHHTPFARFNSDELGNNLPQRMLKDYNGQTYWLSLNIASFLPAAAHFPRWLNLTAGYGAEGMIAATKNPREIKGQPIPDFERYRQYYISFDTDLYRIQSITPFTTALFKINRIFKTPTPGIEWSYHKKTKLHWLYF